MDYLSDIDGSDVTLNGQRVRCLTRPVIAKHPLCSEDAEWEATLNLAAHDVAVTGGSVAVRGVPVTDASVLCVAGGIATLRWQKGTVAVLGR